MNLRRIAWSTLLSGVLLIPMAPGTASGAERLGAPGRDCVPAATARAGTTDHQASCLEIDVRIAELPEVGGTSEVVVEARTTAEEDEAELLIELPAHVEWVTEPSGLKKSTEASDVPIDRGKLHVAEGSGKLTNGEPLRLTGVVKAVGEGPAEIRAEVRSAGGADSAEDSVYLTLGADASTRGIAVDEVNDTATTDEPATRSNLFWDHKPVEAGPGRATPGRRQACAAGSWNYVEHTGYTRVAANAGVQVYDADADGEDDLLAEGLTDEKGRFHLCFDNRESGERTQDVYVRLGTENKQWKVKSNTTGKAYLFDTPTRKNVKSGSVTDFGALQPAASELMRGIEAFDSLNSGWNYLPGDRCWDDRDTDCRQAVVNWEPDSTTCCWFDLQKNEAFIGGATPDTPIVTLHEFAHGLMDDVYDDVWPDTPNCSSHTLHRVSSAGCAWTEGWATYFAGVVIQDPVFRWENGQILDLENATWGTVTPTRVWENGDTVEGRVAGALLDLADNSQHESGDKCFEDSRGALWNTFLTHVSADFEEFWKQRGEDGHDVGETALNCLYFNTIDYR
ncbi:hypothetical protein AB0L39_35040 [Streptomyces parvus]|uniref:hypothetical protein n=1 Tax=Streptomyces parvus TaxID=66428 RepID=UPI00343434D5